jgi:hypothetical protein
MECPVLISVTEVIPQLDSGPVFLPAFGLYDALNIGDPTGFGVLQNELTVAGIDEYPFLSPGPITRVLNSHSVVVSFTTDPCEAQAGVHVLDFVPMITLGQ